jgi:hypothetical protein
MEIIPYLSLSIVTSTLPAFWNHCLYMPFYSLAWLDFSFWTSMPFYRFFLPHSSLCIAPHLPPPNHKVQQEEISDKRTREELLKKEQHGSIFWWMLTSFRWPPLVFTVFLTPIDLHGPPLARRPPPNHPTGPAYTAVEMAPPPHHHLPPSSMAAAGKSPNLNLNLWGRRH